MFSVALVVSSLLIIIYVESSVPRISTGSSHEFVEFVKLVLGDVGNL